MSLGGYLVLQQPLNPSGNSSPSGQNGHHFADDMFKRIFSEWKELNFKYNFTEICSLGPNWQYVSIGSDNGLAPKRRQAIVWTNADPIHCRIYALRGDELIIFPHNRMERKIILQGNLPQVQTAFVISKCRLQPLGAIEHFGDIDSQ